MTPLPEIPGEAINRRWNLGHSEAQLEEGVVLIGNDFVVAKRVIQEFLGVSKQHPNITVTVEVDDETHWRCVEVHITSSNVLDATISGVSLADLATAALANTAFTRLEGNKFTVGPKNEIELLSRLRRSRRRRADAVDLRRVAKVYRDAVKAGDMAPVERVKDEFAVARSTAGRYVTEARKAGHLPATSRGKAQA